MVVDILAIAPHPGFLAPQYMRLSPWFPLTPGTPLGLLKACTVSVFCAACDRRWDFVRCVV
jgi:hypothetical protein